MWLALASRMVSDWMQVEDWEVLTWLGWTSFFALCQWLDTLQSQMSIYIVQTVLHTPHPHTQLCPFVNFKGASNSTFPKTKFTLYPSQHASHCICHPKKPFAQGKNMETILDSFLPPVFYCKHISCCILWILIYQNSSSLSIFCYHFVRTAAVPHTATTSWAS